MEGTQNQIGLVRAPEEQLSAAEKYQVHLPDWTGPYDVLLKVIDEQEMNLLDLDIAKLLEHYLVYIKELEVINLDEAGEFLVVAATLAQIKSKMLLPDEKSEEEEEEIDPRAELVQYLIEYQKFKKAAEQLRERPILGRDVFEKGRKEIFQGLEAEGRGKLFQLVKGFQKAIQRVELNQDFEVEMEEVSVSERFHDIFAQVEKHRQVAFEDFLPEGKSKTFLIASFLAVLELVRMKKVGILQRLMDGPVFLEYREGATDADVVHSEFDEEPEEVEDESV